MLNLTFREIKRVDLIENGKVAHYFKIKYLDNSTAVFDNSWNQLETSKIMEKKNMATKFQKRHYEEIATAFKHIARMHNTPSGYYHCSIELMISNFCELFIYDNSQFKVDSFLDAIELNKTTRENIIKSINEKNV
jgi:hypothetical protein